MTENFSYDDLEENITSFLKDAKEIRRLGNQKYGFHFFENYKEFGLTGFLVNHNEITQRFKQLEKTFRNSSEEGQNTLYVDQKESLKNMLYDDINYCLLFLFWLNREKWAHEITGPENQASDPNSHIMQGAYFNQTSGPYYNSSGSACSVTPYTFYIDSSSLKLDSYDFTPREQAFVRKLIPFLRDFIEREQKYKIGKEAAQKIVQKVADKVRDSSLR